MSPWPREAVYCVTLLAATGTLVLALAIGR